MKNTTKRYHPLIVSKDFTISFIAGIGGGGTFWVFTLLLDFLQKRDYNLFLKGFILYLISGIILWFLLNRIVVYMYGKRERKNSL